MALVLVGTLLGLLAAEAAMRWAMPQPTGVAAGRSSLLRGALTEPGTHRVRTTEVDVEVYVNREGFVDRDWAPRREGVQRVVLIGDSFVQAAQVASGQGVGAMLDATLGDGVEVMSMGVPGAGTATASGLLRRYGIPQDPDLVLLGFLVANDVLNNHPLLEQKHDKPFYRLVDGKLVPTTSLEAEAKPGGLLWERSHLYRWWARWQAKRRLIARKQELGGGLPIDLRVHQPEPDAVWEEAWQVTDALLARMAADCAMVGLPFGIVLFPDAAQASDDARARLVKDWPEAASWDFAAAQARAHEVAGGHAKVLDLLPAFRLAEDPNALYLREDGHWTPDGHRLAAESMAPFVGGMLRGR